MPRLPPPVQTLVPFLRAKLDALYHRQLQAQQQPPQLQQQQPVPAPWPWLQRCRAGALRAFLAAYPWLFAGHEGARFAYQLMYLLGRSPYYSPELHLLGLAVVRLTGQEAVSMAGSACDLSLDPTAAQLG